jgi:hypothetical protein
MDISNFRIIYLGLIEPVLTNFLFCEAVHLILEAGFAFP